MNIADANKSTTDTDKPTISETEKERDTAVAYSRPVLKTGSENPSGKLGGNACCGRC